MPDLGAWRLGTNQTWTEWRDGKMVGRLLALTCPAPTAHHELFGATVRELAARTIYCRGCGKAYRFCVDR